MAQPTVTNVRFQLRRDNATAWASALNPVLLAGEPGYDTTNKILKIGDGTTKWTLLPSISGAGQGATGAAGLPTNGIVGDYLSWTGTQWVAGGGDDVKLGGNSSITGTAKNNVVVGSSASAVEGDVTIGQGAASNFKFNVSVGLETVANGYDVAIGAGVNTQGNDVGIGSNVTSNGYDVAIGSAAKSYHNAVAIGASSKSAFSGTSVGYRALGSGEGSVAIGNTSTANNVSSVAVGSNSISSSDNGVAIGNLANINQGADGAIAIGQLSSIGINSPGSIVIGNQSFVSTACTGSVLIGGSSTLVGTNSIAISAGNLPGKPGPTFPGSDSCYIKPIRALSNPEARTIPVATGTLWYNSGTYEVCYHIPEA